MFAVLLYLAVLIVLFFHFRIARPLRSLSRPWPVVENRAELGRSQTLRLAPDGHPGWGFEGGQFAWINLGRWPFNYAQHPISFSSSGERAAETGEVAFTIKDLGDWSGQRVPAAQAGDRVWLDGPHGVFTIDRIQGPGYVLIAGGVGITPIRSMLATAVGAEEPIKALAPKVYPVPHPVDGPRFADCANCHARGARFQSPANHQTFGNHTCGLCHAFPRPPEAVVEVADHNFGWRSPLGEAAKQDFNLPDRCVLLSSLEQVVTGEHCSVRPDGQACVACHWAGRADGGVRLDNLEDKQDLIDRGYIEGFVSEHSARPPNLKRLFADWQARGYPN